MTEREKDDIAMGVLRVVREVARMVGSGAIPESTGAFVPQDVHRHVYRRATR